MKFLLGADPEMFLVDAAGALVSSIGKVGGSKMNPRPLPIAPGFAVQEDNVALEFNIPPAADAVEFEANIRKTVSYLKAEVLAKYGFDFVNLSAASFPKEQLTHPDAQVFGCDPDFNAWNKGRRNPRPRAKDRNLRSCGGHLHIGYQFQDDHEVQQFIKHCDLYLGVPSVLMDKGDLRKQLYGKAGAYRPKSYGCEYRSLSNFWVFDPTLTMWAHRNVNKALDVWNSATQDVVDHEQVAILDAINNNNKAAAEVLVNKYGLEVLMS